MAFAAAAGLVVILLRFLHLLRLLIPSPTSFSPYSFSYSIMTRRIQGEMEGRPDHHGYWGSRRAVEGRVVVLGGVMSGTERVHGNCAKTRWKRTTSGFAGNSLGNCENEPQELRNSCWFCSTRTVTRCAITHWIRCSLNS